LEEIKTKVLDYEVKRSELQTLGCSIDRLIAENRDLLREQASDPKERHQIAKMLGIALKTTLCGGAATKILGKPTSAQLKLLDRAVSFSHIMGPDASLECFLGSDYGEGPETDSQGSEAAESQMPV
jgi:hypothetical protein